MITIISGTNRKEAVSLEISKLCAKKLTDLSVDNQILNLQNLSSDFTATALYENHGKSEVFNDFVKDINKSDKFIIVVPEYNGSFPGVLKAFIDAMPYPSDFIDKKIALVGISAGNQGAVLALSHLTDILNYLGGNVLGKKIRIPFIAKSLKEGVLDKSIDDLVNDMVEKLLQF